jgi:anthranilate/para-aminobenzoate synthase component II
LSIRITLDALANFAALVAWWGEWSTRSANDEVTVEDLVAKKPTQLVISPGPGHPDTDAGISNARY